MWHIEKLQALLKPEDERQLKEIFSPRVVAVPPDDARRSICVMPDGEIRYYGFVNQTKNGGGSGIRVYYSSYDCGLSWKCRYAPNGSMGPAVYLPECGRFVTIINENGRTYSLVSEIGPDDTSPKKTEISPLNYYDMFQPIVLESGRLICPMQIRETRPDGLFDHCSVVAYSDDYGDSWTFVHLASAPRFEVEYPHRSPRWNNNGSECHIAVMPDKRLMLISRTSLDYFYVFYSSDNGETWTDGEPSDFHGTLTTPFFLPLSDGRTVFFWNNTHPLPEVDKSSLIPPQHETVMRGIWEDVFTNRDACHAAISDDCIEWIGRRELFLNDIRNEPDFRSRFGLLSSNDRSVHQFQAIELPYGKILVAFGQSEASRRMVIFDVNWLYETERREDFTKGTQGISTHLYVRSYSGSTGNGHCAWNRTDGALLMPSPNGSTAEALQICRTGDKRLFSDKQGVVWNFPNATEGKVTIELSIIGSGIQVCLCDQWFNPSDEYVPLYAPFTFTLDSFILGHERRIVEIVFNTKNRVAVVSSNGNKLFSVPMKNEPFGGISYLHLQTLAEGIDFDGTYLHCLEMSAIKAEENN
jgi:hypothetical protein